MRKSFFYIFFALLLSPFDFANGADQKPSLDPVGDFDKTLPSKRNLVNSAPKILKMDLTALLKYAELLLKKHQYDKAIKILNHRLDSEPTNERIIIALVDARKAYAEDLCLRKEFERATIEYKAALSLMSVRK
jgi:tetratricopeptide (TPR) repeat protein